MTPPTASAAGLGAGRAWGWVAAMGACAAWVGFGFPPAALPLFVLVMAGGAVLLLDTRIGLYFTAFAIVPLGIVQAEIASITLDPQGEMADTDLDNNRFPRLPIEESFQLQKTKTPKNPKQELKTQEAKKK